METKTDEIDDDSYENLGLGNNVIALEFLKLVEKYANEKATGYMHSLVPHAKEVFGIQSEETFTTTSEVRQRIKEGAIRSAYIMQNFFSKEHILTESLFINDAVKMRIQSASLAEIQQFDPKIFKFQPTKASRRNWHNLPIILSLEGSKDYIEVDWKELYAPFIKALFGEQISENLSEIEYQRLYDLAVVQKLPFPEEFTAHLEKVKVVLTFNKHSDGGGKAPKYLIHSVQGHGFTLNSGKIGFLPSMCSENPDGLIDQETHFYASKDGAIDCRTVSRVRKTSNVALQTVYTIMLANGVYPVDDGNQHDLPGCTSPQNLFTKATGYFFGVTEFSEAVVQKLLDTSSRYLYFITEMNVQIAREQFGEEYIEFLRENQYIDDDQHFTCRDSEAIKMMCLRAMMCHTTVGRTQIQWM
jgi:hypothetical protein